MGLWARRLPQALTNYHYSRSLAGTVGVKTSQVGFALSQLLVALGEGAHIPGSSKVSPPQGTVFPEGL